MGSRPAADDERGGVKALAETITAIIGALTAAAALIVIPGSVAMLLRLGDQELPADLGVVANLPRELLFAIGFGYVLVPLLFILGLAIPLLALSSRPQEWPGRNLWISRLNRTSGEPDLWQTLGVGALVLAGGALVAGIESLIVEEEWSWPWYVLVVAVPTVLVGLAALILAPQAERRARNVLLAFLSGALVAGLPFAVDSEPGPLAFLGSWVTVVLWLVASRLVAREFLRRDLRPVTAVALFVLAGLLFLPWTVAFAVHRGEIPQTTVCTTQGERIDGRLVGETSDRFYIGESPYRVVSLVFHNELEDLVQEAFRSADEPFDFRERAVSVSRLSRVDLVVTDHPLQSDVAARLALFGVPAMAVEEEDLGRRPIELRARADDLLGIGDAAEQEEREEEDAIVRSQPAQRIVALPAGEVSRIYVGGSGACPVGPSAEEGTPPSEGETPAAGTTPADEIAERVPSEQGDSLAGGDVRAGPSRD